MIVIIIQIFINNSYQRWKERRRNKQRRFKVSRVGTLGALQVCESAIFGGSGCVVRALSLALCCLAPATHVWVHLLLNPFSSSESPLCECWRADQARWDRLAGYRSTLVYNITVSFYLDGNFNGLKTSVTTMTIRLAGAMLRLFGHFSGELLTCDRSVVH